MIQLSTMTAQQLRDAHLAAVAAADNALADAAWEIFISRYGERRDPIVTWHAFPPIPVRDFDWGAHRDSDEGGEGRMGWGRTEAEAIYALLDLEREAQADEDVAADAAAEHERVLAAYRLDQRL